MNREQMVEKAAEILEAKDLWCNDCDRDRCESCLDRGRTFAATVLDAILPQVTTVAELKALPVGTKLLDQLGDVWWRTRTTWNTNGDQRKQAQQWPSRYLISNDGTFRTQPLTVVWTPEAS